MERPRDGAATESAAPVNALVIPPFLTTRLLSEQQAADYGGLDVQRNTSPPLAAQLARLPAAAAFGVDWIGPETNTGALPAAENAAARCARHSDRAL